MVKPTLNHQAASVNTAAAALFFSNNIQPVRNVAAAGKNSSSNNINNHAEKEEDPDFKELVSQLKVTANKMPLKKQWKRKKAHWSSEKINEWWARANDCAKEAAMNTSTNSSSSSNEQSSSHFQQQVMMIQAVSAAVAKLGQDKKNDPECLRETYKEQRIMLRKQCKSSNNDFKLLWKSVWARVAEIHGIAIMKRRNSAEQQQQQQVGARKPPPDVANAIAAAAKAAASKAGNNDEDNDPLAGPPIKKRKKMVANHQQQQPNLENNDSMRIGERNHVYTSTTAWPARTAAASNNSQVSSSGNLRRPKVEPRDNNIDKPGVETIVIDDDSDDDDASCVQQQQQQPEPPLTAEQLRFQKMVQDIDDESASDRHVPLQVILKKHRQEWENHLVSQGPMAKRLSKTEFASLWDRVEQEACENWTQRIHQSTNSPMDWSFLVFGKHYDAKKATAYFQGWDTMARASP